MDCIIPFSQSESADSELLYTLRSLSKNIAGLGKVFVIGDKPRLQLNPSETTFISFANIYDDPKFENRNLVNKILKACADERVSKRGVIMCPLGTYTLAPMDAEIIPNYHKGRVWMSGNLVENNTRSLFPDVKINNYNTGGPYIILPAAFHTYMTQGINWSTPGGYDIKTVYAVKCGTEGEYYCGLRINAHINDDQADKIITAGRRYFTTAGDGFKYGVQNWLRSRFPDKSKFEN